MHADACDLYVMKPVHFENHMYCDATLCVVYVMKILHYDCQDHPDNFYLDPDEF